MFRIALRSLLALVFATVAAAAHAAQPCGFLPVSEVDQTFPEFAPWQTMVGGAIGHCTFTSDERKPPNAISFMQQFKTTKADATRVFDAMRKGFAESYAIADVPSIGDRAFRYTSKDNTHITAIIVQKDKLVVTVQLTLQRAVTDDDVRNAMKLGQIALRGAGDPETARKASTCPWFNEASLNKLFGGKPYEVQVHGENSCMAADTRQKPKRVLLVSALEMSRGFSLNAMRSEDCQYRDLPELGKDARLSFACKDGNPRASVGISAHGLEIDFKWVPAGVEPSDADKAALIELANYVRSAEK